jgi:hypothetical protein
MITLAAISLLGPAMLGGLALLALPVIAHLLHRNARTPVVFPSVRLLRVSAASQSSLFRLRRRLLLLIRSLAIAALVFAFSEPLWSGATGESGGEAGSTVVILDASASTSRRDGPTSLFERLRGEASRAIEALTGGRDRAEIILADAAPHGLAGTLTPNLSMLGELLGEAAATDARADLAAAIRLAGQTLGEAEGGRHVVIVTDAQASSWRDLAERSLASDAAGDLLPPGTTVRIVTPNDGDGSAVANVGLESRGLSQSRAAPGQALAARVRLNAFGADATVTLRVAVDGKPTEVRPLTVVAGRPREEVFLLTANEPGPHAIAWTIDHDALTSDDAAYASFEVGSRQPIGILSDEDPTDPTRATYFLLRALAPYGDQRDRFAPRVVRVAELTAAAVADLRTIFVGDITRLDDGQVGVLRSHLERGGAVVWFCGGGALQENLTRLETAMPGLLPFLPGLSSEREGRLIAGAARRSMLATFDDASFVGLGQIRVGRLRQCTAIRDDAMHVLAFDEGTPALSLRRYGEGAFALANFSAAPKSGDLGRHGAFVALVQSLATELELADGAFRPTYVGEALLIACGGDGGALAVRDPSGAPIADAVILQDRTQTSVALQRTRRAGAYEVTSSGRTVAIGVVNVDPRESDPKAMDAEAIAAMLRPHGAGDSADAPVAAGAMPIREGTPLWWVAIVVALGLVGIELALLAAWKR